MKNPTSKFLNFINANWIKILIAVLVLMVTIWLYRFFFKTGPGTSNGGSWLDLFGLGGASSPQKRIEEGCTNLVSDNLSQARKDDIQNAADVIFEITNENNDLVIFSYGCENKRGVYQQTANQYLQDIAEMRDEELEYLCKYYNASKRGNSTSVKSLVNQLLQTEVCLEDSLQANVVSRLQALGNCCKK